MALAIKIGDFIGCKFDEDHRRYYAEILEVLADSVKCRFIHSDSRYTLSTENRVLSSTGAFQPGHRFVIDVYYVGEQSESYNSIAVTFSDGKRYIGELLTNDAPGATYKVHFPHTGSIYYFDDSGKVVYSTGGYPVGNIVSDIRFYNKKTGSPFLQSEDPPVAVDPIDIKLRMFIPSRIAYISYLPLANEVGYGGDNRTFSYEEGSSRAELWADGNFDTIPNQPITVKRKAFGKSTMYHKHKLVDVWGKPSWWRDVKKTPFLDVEEPPDDTGTATVTDESIRLTGRMEASIFGLTSVLHVNFFIQGKLPLDLLAPAFNCDLNLFLTRTPGISFMIQGMHDGFPAYELYLNRRLIYHYDPVSAGVGPEKLMPPMDVNVNVPLTVFT